MEQKSLSDSAKSDPIRMQLSPDELGEMDIKSKTDQGKQFIGELDAYEERTRVAKTEIRKNNLLLAQLLQNRSK